MTYVSRQRSHGAPLESFAPNDDPQPPFQVRGVEMLYLEGRMELRHARRLLPPWLSPAETGAMQMAIFTVPEGWGLAPCTSCYIRLALSDFDSPDGSEALFSVARSFSTAAAEIWSRHYSDHCAAAESRLEVHSDRITGEGGLSEGARLTIGVRRQHRSLTSTAGAHMEIVPQGPDFVRYSTGYSCLMEPVLLEDFELHLPPGHRLEAVRDGFTPVEASFLREKSFSTGLPQRVWSGHHEANQAAPALLDLIGRLNLPCLIFEMNGRLAYLSASAERMGSTLAAITSTVRSAALKEPMPRPFALDGPVRLSLPDGTSAVIRLIPLPTALWGSPSVLCILADLGRLAPRNPEPALVAIGLTPAEARIARHLANGLSAPHAAAELGISPHTVRSGLKSIYGKLHISSRAELAILVERLIN